MVRLPGGLSMVSRALPSPPALALGLGLNRSDFECRLGEREDCGSDRQESEHAYMERHAKINGVTRRFATG
jgi:hypothetical protein